MLPRPDWPGRLMPLRREVAAYPRPMYRDEQWRRCYWWETGCAAPSRDNSSASRCWSSLDGRPSLDQLLCRRRRAAEEGLSAHTEYGLRSCSCCKSAPSRELADWFADGRPREAGRGRCHIALRKMPPQKIWRARGGQLSALGTTLPWQLPRLQRRSSTPQSLMRRAKKRDARQNIRGEEAGGLASDLDEADLPSVQGFSFLPPHSVATTSSFLSRPKP